MRVGVLGPVEAYLDGQGVDLGTPKQRALVTALAMSHGRPASVDAIIDLLWGDDAPAGVTATLQAYVSGLRRVLEPGRERRAPATVLVTVAPGYALRLDDDALDAAVFEKVVTVQHRRLSKLDDGLLPRTDLITALQELDAALALWRGTPYVELEDAPAAVAERARLEELRLVALEDRAVAELALGRHATVAADLEALTVAHPLRERLWALRALALTRCGRQADALDVLRQVRELLADELGLEPSAELRDLQAAVLRQDTSLAWVAPPDRAAEPRSEQEPELEVPSRPGPEPTAALEVAWPMVGRDDELTSLVDTLGKSSSGTPGFAVVTGEPGIGKTRLTEELARYAAAQGARVLTGKGSQDDGAPPLWPWSTVLEGLGASLPTLDGSDEGSQFRVWEQITRLVRRNAREQTTLVVLDDLHWADSASLRVLRLLAETAKDEKLLVVATWRPHPEPTGTLADAAEALARRHAVRLSLRGLEPEDAAVVIETVAETAPSSDQAAAIRERTDGNPFYLVEYARLAGARGGLEQLLDDDPPAAVQEVVSRRFARLPQETVDVLRLAAVVGRSFDSPTVARAGGFDEDDLLDLVEPAQAAGLIREDGIDRFSFSHALVRDTLLSAMSPSRRARAHRRVAEALAGTTGRENELALHWRGAGSAHAAEAWRASMAAADAAARLQAHEQRVELIQGALDSMELDPGATPRDRFDALMELAASYRWVGLQPELTDTVTRAITVAEELGDPELVIQAATETTKGAIWQTAAYGESNPHVIEALRGALGRLPSQDSSVRGRGLLALAGELYSTASFEERRALIDEALAMADRLGDVALKMHGCVVAFQALWCAHTAPERLELTSMGFELAQQIGDLPTAVTAATMRTICLGELGRPAEMWESYREAVAIAERLRLPFPLLVLHAQVISWHAMAGRFDEAQRLLELCQRIAEAVSYPHAQDAVMGAVAAVMMYQGASGVAAGVVAQIADGSTFPLTGTIVSLYSRAGMLDEAREYYAAHPIDLEGDEDWFSLFIWSMAAETALAMGDSALAAQAYERLSPYQGRNASPGSGNSLGPVDSFLALAAFAVGERELAVRHADEAERLIQEWDTPLVGEWLADQRRRHAF